MAQNGWVMLLLVALSSLYPSTVEALAGPRAARKSGQIPPLSITQAPIINQEAYLGSGSCDGAKETPGLIPRQVNSVCGWTYIGGNRGLSSSEDCDTLTTP